VSVPLASVLIYFTPAGAYGKGSYNKNNNKKPRRLRVPKGRYPKRRLLRRADDKVQKQRLRKITKAKAKVLSKN
jgi:hypothetical protein